MRLRRVRPGRKQEDGGWALVSALGTGSVVMLLAFLLLQTTVLELLTARGTQDAGRATAAAQAGIDDYLAQLSEDPTYWQQGNADASNAAMTAVGKPVPGSSDSSQSFRYTVLSSAADVTSTGTVQVQVTGKASDPNGRSVSRTLTATFSSGDRAYAYFSDIESWSPDIAYFGHENSNCDRYWYAGRSGYDDAEGDSDMYDPSGCFNESWTSRDTVTGPVHSNDALKISGSPTFNGPVTTAWPAAQSSATTWWGPSSGVSGYRPQYADPVTFPSGDTSGMRAYTDPYTSGAPGCYYKGATKIVFTGDTMSVQSPATTSAPSRCYDVSPARRATLQTGLAIPPVIYVDSNAAAWCGASWLIPGQVGYPTGTTWAGAEYYDGDVYARESPDGLFGPIPLVWGWSPNYCNGRGTAYVSGQANSAVTVATADDVVITGDLTVPSLTGSALIGLYARSSVFVRHPTNYSGTNLEAPVSTVQAAIIALQNQFMTQYTTHGAPLGTLTINGSVTTKYRGPMSSTVGTGTHGYSAVNYVLDTRLNTTTPPYWPSQPTQATGSRWRMSSVRNG